MCKCFVCLCDKDIAGLAAGMARKPSRHRLPAGINHQIHNQFHNLKKHSIHV